MDRFSTSASTSATQFHPAVTSWFQAALGVPTEAQLSGWAAIGRGDSTLIQAPTGSGKTLAAFLWCLDRLMFKDPGERARHCRVVYVSPLKALAADIERNLKLPIAGIARAAERLGVPYRVPTVAMRTGDTPQKERARFARAPTDILITTPESLYLLLTSAARTGLTAVETLIVDEIHALVATKRGSHLALSLERLEAIAARPRAPGARSSIQRIGLSATQRPLEEVALFLGGVESSAPFALEPPAPRPVQVIAVSTQRQLELSVELPAQPQAVNQEAADPTTPARSGPVWVHLTPRLLELVLAHRSTLIFVNSRRVAERLAGAINELAGHELVRAHHGSLAQDKRRDIEESLKRGTLKGLVATSSLELGIDMAAVEFVVQVGAPPSVASGLQRLGRAGHQVGEISRGVLFPLHRADLLSCATTTAAMRAGAVEATRMPQCPLDVLSQQIVAEVATEPQKADELFARFRCAAPFRTLARPAFDSLLALLSGETADGGVAELLSDVRPRISWDRQSGRLTPRPGAKAAAITNAGAIPDRGLYKVFLAGADGSEKSGPRIGELDEEMVFESKPGEVFVLGASSWRIESIGHDRVLVSPAPGEPGKTPFWRGEAAARPLELGQAIGALTRKILESPRAEALAFLTREHCLDETAATALCDFLEEQKRALGAVPDDRHIVIERYRDIVGDTRLCLLSPFGSRVHAPWCLAVQARLRDHFPQPGGPPPIESMWTDDGFVIRVPTGFAVPDAALFAFHPAEIEDRVVTALGGSSLLGARFREAAFRALLLLRRKPGTRTPLWHQRKRAADLLRAAAAVPDFPLLLEAYRECVNDSFDLPALRGLLGELRQGTMRLSVRDTTQPSPFASSLFFFSYLAGLVYESDAPLPEKRAQALHVDPVKLRSLLGDLDLRELLDPQVMAEFETEQQALAPTRKAASADELFDVLRRLGDLTRAELLARCVDPAQAPSFIAELLASARVTEVLVAGQPRLVLSTVQPRYVAAFSSGPEAAEERRWLIRRYARTHAPFALEDVAARYGLSTGELTPLSGELLANGRLIVGQFWSERPRARLCDAEVLDRIRRRSLRRAQRAVQPVPKESLGLLMPRLQGVVGRRPGLDALLDAIAVLQGAPLVASQLESAILPARVRDYHPTQLDTLLAAGEVVWRGLSPLGERDGRLALFLTDEAHQLFQPSGRPDELSERAAQILAVLQKHGASFFAPLHEAVAAAAGSPSGPTVDALWELVFAGLISNDGLAPLRAYLRGTTQRGQRAGDPEALMTQRPSRRALTAAGFRSRRTECPPAAAGRWVVVSDPRPSDTVYAAAVCRTLLARHGVLTKAGLSIEVVAGGWAGIYPALRGLSDAGKVRRGLFVADAGPSQFVAPAALDLLRSLGSSDTAATANTAPEVTVLTATDPANPYGAVVPWPVSPTEVTVGEEGKEASSLARAAGAWVILVDGQLAGYLRRHSQELTTFVLWSDDAEPQRSRLARGLSQGLAELAGRAFLEDARQGPGLCIATINRGAVAAHPLAPFLLDAGFFPGSAGFLLRRTSASGRVTNPLTADSYSRYQSKPLDRDRTAPASEPPDDESTDD